MSINYSSQRNSNNISIGLTADDTTIASTAVIGDNSLFNQVGTCTNAAYALRLPQHPKMGVPYFVKNNGDHMASVFPFNATSSIDGATAGTAFVLANNGSEASFVAVQITPLASNTSTVVWQAFGKSGHGVIATTAAITLQACPNYQNQVHVSQAAAYAITIPDPEDAVGMEIILIDEVEGANTVTCTSGSADLNGLITLSDANNVVDGDTTLSLVATHCQKGDKVELISDGTQWSCIAVSQSADANDGITVA